MTARTMRISILRFDDVPYGGTFTGPFFHFYRKNSPDAHILLRMLGLQFGL